jgi:GNAT superfamily N-acetyltransferase
VFNGALNGDHVNADVVVRRIGPDDIEHVKWALYTAVSWNPDRPLPPIEAVIEHPQLAIYHRNWGRMGDLGVIAQENGEVVGVAMCRSFDADEEHGHGYVDSETPELAIGVVAERRGEGIGAWLMKLAAPRAAGFRQLSLSVTQRTRPAGSANSLATASLADEGGVRVLLSCEARAQAPIAIVSGGCAWPTVRSRDAARLLRARPMNIADGAVGPSQQRAVSETQRLQRFLSGRTVGEWRRAELTSVKRRLRGLTPGGRVVTSSGRVVARAVGRCWCGR